MGTSDRPDAIPVAQAGVGAEPRLREGSATGAPATLDPLTVSLEGTQLIEASAGTGKTHAIATLYLRLVLGLGDETPRQVRNILVVTFTRAATEELRGRVRGRLFEALDVLERVRGAAAAATVVPNEPSREPATTSTAAWLDPESDAGKSLDVAMREMLAAIIAAHRIDEAITRLKLELATIDDAAIYTIHGFCQRALQEQAFDSGEAFELELVQDDSRRELQAVQDHWRARYYVDDMLAEFARVRFGTPDALYKRVKPLLQPGLTLKLERVSKDDLLALRSALIEQWARESGALKQAIKEFKALSRGPYKDDAIADAATSVDRWCNGGLLLLPGDATLFGRASLDANLTKKARDSGVRFPDHPLVTSVSAYGDACKVFEQTMVADAAADTRSRLERSRHDAGVAGFDDLVVRLHAALTAPSGERLAQALAKRYPVALIDEFQDTDPLQYGIFSAIYGNENGDNGLLLIGDPKQAIYSFRGADIFAYMGARRDTDPAHRHSIDTNWRSVRPLVDALNVLFERRSAPFLYADDIAYQSVKAAGKADEKRLVENGKPLAPLEFWLLPDGEKGALTKEKAADATLPRMARRIAELLAHGQRGGKPLAPRDIAVLVRTNDQGADVQQALRRLGIGSAMAGTDSVFASDEARALRTVLGAIVEPASDRALRRALVSPIWRHDAAYVATLGDDLATYEKLLLDLQDWRTTWLARGFMPMFRRFMNAGGVAAAMLSLPDGERRLTNLVQIAELMQQASREHPTPEALIRWLDDNIAEPDGNADDQQLRLESDEDLVQVLTLHRAKGLQYAVVFLPFLYAAREVDPKKEAPRYHDANRKLVVDLAANADSVEKAEYERLAEDMRLVYVGLTRAKDYCVVPWGRINKTDHSALAYLLHGPDGLTRVDELAAKMKGMSHADIRAELGALAARHGEWFRVVEVGDRGEEIRVQTEGEGRAKAEVRTNVEGTSEFQERAETQGDTEALARSKAAPPAASKLEARESTRAVRQGWATTSFSRLVEEGSDEVRDVGAAREPRGSGLVLPQSDDASPAAVTASTSSPIDQPSGTVTQFTLPGGKEIGTMFHDILEEIDYAPTASFLPPGVQVAGAGSSEPLREVVAKQLGRHARPDSWCDVVTSMIATTLDVELEPGFALRSLTRDRRRNEIEFWYPIKSLRPDVLDAQLPGLGAGIESRRLTFQPVNGYLEGFIDLVFEHDGRWHVLDWKTNRLGPDATFYTREHMAREIASSRYDLQYTLYTVALHRHLQRALGSRYDPARHLGGVYYLFLRGLRVGDPARPGIWHAPVDVARIEALDALFRGTSPEARA